MLLRLKLLFLGEVLLVKLKFSYFIVKDLFGYLFSIFGNVKILSIAPHSRVDLKMSDVNGFPVCSLVFSQIKFPT